MKPSLEPRHFFISPGHNFFGHHGGPAGIHPLIEVDEIKCVAGRGIEGDRFLDHKENYKGQITFFAEEVFQSLCAALALSGVSPGALRRNVITRGMNLNELIGKEFEIQGVRFLGTEECKPCDWMDQAVGPGAKAVIKGRGGLRARILSDGILRIEKRNREVMPSSTGQ